MKKILHQKIDMDKIDASTMWNMHNWLNKLINENSNGEYIVVTSPNELSVLEDDQTVIVIEAKQYTFAELLDVIEKASIYDDLCK